MSKQSFHGQFFHPWEQVEWEADNSRSEDACNHAYEKNGHPDMVDYKCGICGGDANDQAGRYVYQGQRHFCWQCILKMVIRLLEDIHRPAGIADSFWDSHIRFRAMLALSYQHAREQGDEQAEHLLVWLESLLRT